MSKGTILFYPFRYEEISYIYMIQDILNELYNVEDYEEFKLNNSSLDDVRCIYLNWIENTLSSTDVDFIDKAKLRGVKIIWVFHNRFPHDKCGDTTIMKNMHYLSSVSDIVVLHSHESAKYLDEYSSGINNEKVFIPHINFIDSYGNLGKVKLNANKDTFVFSAIGMIRPYKNYEILISAFNELSIGRDTMLILAGEANDERYIEDLYKLKAGNNRIIIYGNRVSPLEMGTLLSISDIMVFPYDTRSGMNSGAMIMGFSYKKTAIVSNIAMAAEYDDELIYKYSYKDNHDHIKKLICAMKSAYMDGKKVCSDKGGKLYNIVKYDNSRETVKKKLMEIV